jgi:CheY-like chemotaxis protein
MAKVLVVDDDPDFVKVTTKVLEKAGHEVVSAANGAKALATMRQDAPDVVVLDVMMSYILDGLDVSREMAEDPALKEVPILMCTSLKGVKGTDVPAADAHVSVDHWLSKPINPDELLERVGQVLN